MDYPLGGPIVQTDTDFGSVELFGVEYSGPEVFTPTAGDHTDLAGLVLARNVAGTKLVAYVAAQFGVDETGTPVAVLGSNVVDVGGPTDQNIRVIALGQVRLERLHTAAAPTAAITIADRDRLKAAGILARATTALDFFDNS